MKSLCVELGSTYCPHADWHTIPCENPDFWAKVPKSPPHTFYAAWRLTKTPAASPPRGCWPRSPLGHSLGLLRPALHLHDLLLRVLQLHPLLGQLSLHRLQLGRGSRQQHRHRVLQDQRDVSKQQPRPAACGRQSGKRHVHGPWGASLLPGWWPSPAALQQGSSSPPAGSKTVTWPFHVALRTQILKQPMHHS